MNYKYICTECCFEYVLCRLDFKHNCPVCNGAVICHYVDDDIEINRDWYNAIKQNKTLGETFTYRCAECSNEKQLLAKDLHGIVCNECFELMHRSIENMPDILKEYRKTKKLNQSQMADKLKITRSLLSMVEIGQRNLPDRAQMRLNKLLA